MLRITEALVARDHAVQKMEILCASNRSKESVISRLKQEKAYLEKRLASSANVPGILKVDLRQDTEGVQQECRKLEEENRILKAKLESMFQRSENITSPRLDALSRTPSLEAKVCAHVMAHPRTCLDAAHTVTAPRRRTT